MRPSDIDTASQRCGAVLCNTYASIFSGSENVSEGDHSTIQCGTNNIISSGSDFGIIGGGDGHRINSTALHAGIFSGYNNTIDDASDCSAILGGSDNNISGFQWAGVFGNSINAVASETFHVNCVNVRDMPSAAGGTGTFVTGTLYFDPTTCAVYWQP